MNSGRFYITGNFFVDAAAFMCVGVVASCSAAQFEWKTSEPENHGLFVKELNNLKNSLAARNTKLAENLRVLCDLCG